MVPGLIDLARLAVPTQLEIVGFIAAYRHRFVR
jgi:hypothetical protein